MTELLGLSTFDITLFAIICFAADIVRGFAGFALSALVMASAATIISPITLIPVLWFLEMAASLQMAGGGWRDANRTIAILLVVGNFIGFQPLSSIINANLVQYVSPTFSLLPPPSSLLRRQGAEARVVREGQATHLRL